MKRVFEAFTCDTSNWSYTTTVYILSLTTFILLINPMNMVNATTK